MAIWQYELEACPRRALLAAFPASPTTIPLESLEDRDLWADLEPPSATELASILPPGTSWSPQLKLWGNHESHEISYCVDGCRIDRGIRIRIDLREPAEELLQQVLEMCSRHDLLLLNMQGKVIEPRLEPVLEDLMTSASWEFMQDPRGFLSRLAEGRTEERGPGGASRE